jgi:hypothetical protein
MSYILGCGVLINFGYSKKIKDVGGYPYATTRAY